MNIEEFRDYCLAKPGTTEETPFGPDTLVFKVGGKIYALTSIDDFGSVNLKCEPERAVQLREEFDFVVPGYHMNKKHWNTVLIGTGVTLRQLREFIDHSYDLVRASLPRAVQAELAEAEKE
ncbi:MmcQ/YjbR family DNA-binding protein [Hymenobacter busanensis]|uniref:MmcQ/YjbR family DNA-binding protein n=1 Tax=Hymenobacter busanensis TaxID=2607656 RepID=A0A7L4ZTJ0_9BACT|nr:MmcQ/YjbR family DNA-binding protein [Hymenobacter busanensis]KAA9325883.1 MmcQ/YjbR family DNA-binding protein [Hymenobacter busanensis]QHJ06277.1 MmcQ/YjbR family DNA-binding protein [Hymenobacter busanensis]